MIPAGSWVAGDGGQFYVTEPQWQASDVKVVVVQDGQIIADVTQEIAVFAAGLRHLPELKTWELELEIGGIITPTDIHAPFFVQTAGARLSMLQVGNGLEQLSARLREAEGMFR